MGQKVNPHGLRVGVIKDWDSRWYARNEKVGDLLVEDYKLRNDLKKRLYAAGVPKIEIERDNAKIRIYVHCARPGMIIGKGGEEIEKLRAELEKKLGKSVVLNIVEVKNPDMDAQLVAENIAQQLEKRIAFRRAMKNAMGRAMRMGALGIKVQASAVSTAPRSPAPSSTMTAPSPCRPSGPTLSTALPRLPPPTAASASRCGSTRARYSPRPCAPPPAPSTPRTTKSASSAPAAGMATAVRAASTGRAVTVARAASTARAAAVPRATAPLLPRKEALSNASA